jgi:hypothetical protein
MSMKESAHSVFGCALFFLCWRGVRGGATGAGSEPVCGDGASCGAANSWRCGCDRRAWAMLRSKRGVAWAKLVASLKCGVDSRIHAGHRAPHGSGYGNRTRIMMETARVAQPRISSVVSAAGAIGGFRCAAVEGRRCMGEVGCLPFMRRRYSDSCWSPGAA